MKKVAIGAVLVLMATVGFGVYYLLSNLDSMVKTAIETYGSEATQTAVRVGGVKINLQDGSGAIRGLTVGSPQGFAAPLAFSLGEISIKVGLKSLSEEVTVIEQVTVVAPKIFFELNKAGKDNLGALKDNLSSGAAGKSSTSSSKKSSAPEPKLIIRKLLFADGNIHARVVSLDKDYELKLPRIELNNLGGKDGATPTQIADQVLKILTDKALAEVKRQGIDQYKTQLKGEVNKRLAAEQEKLNEKVGDEVGDKLKGLINY